MLARDELTGFLKALCRYYSDFLETDFHASRAPSRKILTTNSKGQLLAFDLAQYPDIGRATLSSFLERFETALPTITRSDTSTSNARSVTESAATVPLYRRALDLYKNLELLDKHSAYLYLFPFELDGVAYPLIYVPIDLTLSDTHDQIALDPAPAIFINVQALRYMASSLSERLNRKWSIDVPDRQLFLGSLSNQELLTEVQRLFNVLTDFDDSESISARKFGDGSVGKTLSLRNTVYLAIAPQGDEALVSDYEDLLLRLQHNPDDPSIAGMMDVIESFLFQNPQSVQRIVEEQLNDEPMTSRISYPSPIPLNAEQLMVAQALRMPECTRVVIEGPPGTGKSHTIAGLVFEALRDGKSVLLVSDKKEALDVVEDKINSVLDASKLDDSFQNPILRLGTKNNNFSRIFYEGNLVKIRARQQALRMRAGSIDATVRRLQNEIHEGAHQQIASRIALHADEAATAFEFERTHQALAEALDLADIKAEGSEALVELTTAASRLKEAVQAVYPGPLVKVPELFSQLSLEIDAAYRSLKALSEIPQVQQSKFLADANSGNISLLEALPGRILSLKSGITGFLFKGKSLDMLAQELLQAFPASGTLALKSRIDEIARDAGLLRKASSYQRALDVLGIDCFDVLRDGQLSEHQTKLVSLQEAMRAYDIALKKVPLTAAKFGFAAERSRHFMDEPLSVSISEASSLVGFAATSKNIAELCSKVTPGSYLAQRGEIEKNLTLTMSSLLDQSVISYSEDHKADAVTVRKLLRERKQIPRALLPAVASAFPCIIIGIRELGSYIPFEYGLFDIVIIDEASQVSIAQALPAILRAKKAVVLGDPRQFSNVKAAFAGTELNAAAFSRVRAALGDALKDSDRDSGRHLLDKSSVFNIKTSVLEFTRYLANYTGFLRKHFRGYSELINYSNEQFYKNMLQVMKIRWKPLSEVIQFAIVASEDALPERVDNTNEDEADFILAELNGLVERDFKGSVAVITPFTDQQSLIMSKVLSAEHSREFRKQLRLKVMTFDTCQGEERDLVYYSMVERAGENTLRYIFPASIKAVDEEDGDLRRQRLNVGLSRARETVKFVLSKPAADFVGEIGNALRAFERQLSKPDFAVLQAQTDSRSPKEAEILQALSQTSFYRESGERLEIRPQFPIGELIRQLNPFAEVPKYVSDFLLIYRETDGTVQRAILEYDGIESHFEMPELVTKDTYDLLRCEGDVERMRIIESYGYPIISLNKFVLGRQPVVVLDKILNEVFKKKTSDFEERLAPILRKYAPLQRRTCLRCGVDRPIEAFFSESLPTGTGRVCAVCDPKRGLEKADVYLQATNDPPSENTSYIFRRDGTVGRRANPEEVGREFYSGALPTQTDISMLLANIQRQGGLPTSRTEALRRVRQELFGRYWLRGDQKKSFEAAFGAAVRWLYTGEVRNAKYGE